MWIVGWGVMGMGGRCRMGGGWEVGSGWVEKQVTER